MRTTLFLGILAAAILFAGCSSAPSDTEPAAPAAAPEAAPASDESQGSGPQRRTASGTIASASGDVSARFEAEVLVPSTEREIAGRASPLANIRFFDLTLPYESLSVGGALYPRGDDPCFDAALRSGGGVISPDAQGSASTRLPFEAEGYELSELVLYLNYTQVDSGTTDCMEPVVASAPLVWEKSVLD